MGRIVTEEDIEATSPRSVAVTTASSVLSQSRLGRTRRKSITIIPLTAAVTVTIVKTDPSGTAVANKGIVLTANQPMTESDFGDSKCYQGAYLVVGSGNGTVAVSEDFER
jgi:hypothetical protein